MKKKLLLILLLTVAALALAACAPKAPAATPTPEPQVEAPTETPAEAPAEEAVPEEAVQEEAAPEGSLELTLEELAKYNGKNGERAYVAVDGVIYDVTDSRAWKNGDHNGFEAGKDLTEEIKTKSPHGVAKLSGVLEVGKLKAE